MKTQDDKDPLWDLLGEASEQKPDAYFSRNVVREVRNLPTQEASWWKSFKAPQLAAACIAIVATIGVVAFHASSSSVPTVAAAQEKFESENHSLTEDELHEILTPISVVAHLDTTEFDAFHELLEL